MNDVYSLYVPYVIDAVYSVAHALDMSTRDTSRMDNDGQRNPYLKLNDMQSLLSRVNFTGLTGKIFFDEFGDRQSASYDIVSYQQETENDAMRLKRVIVGEWHDREGLQLIGTIRWKSQTGRFPKSDNAQPEQENPLLHLAAGSVSHVLVVQSTQSLELKPVVNVHEGNVPMRLRQRANICLWQISIFLVQEELQFSHLAHWV